MPPEEWYGHQRSEPQYVWPFPSGNNARTSSPSPDGMLRIGLCPFRGGERSFAATHQGAGGSIADVAAFCPKGEIVKGFGCRPGCDLAVGIIGRGPKASEERTRGERFPVLVAIGAEPIAGIIVVFVGEPDRDPIFAKAHSSLTTR